LQNNKKLHLYHGKNPNSFWGLFLNILNVLPEPQDTKVGP
jgi:hypothetical protein